MGWVPRFFCCCRSQVFANSFFSQVFTNSPFSQVFTSSPFSQVFTSSPFSQEASSPVEHTPSAISIETLWTQSTALASSSSSLQQQANTATSTTSNQTQPTPHIPQQPPTHPQRWGGDVLVSPTNWDRWLTLTMLQFHPIVLAMTADGILRIVCMRLCGEPIRVLITLPPPPPPTHTHRHTHTHTHTLHPTQDNAVELSPPVLHDIHIHTFSAVRWAVLHACYAYAYLFFFFSRTQTSSACHTYAYFFQSYVDLFHMLYICIPI